MKNKTVLISGVTSGIGRATVFQLLKDGFSVSGFAPQVQKCRALSKELAQLFDPANFLILPADVRHEKSLKTVVAATLKRYKHIDVLINNAGYGFFVEPDAVDVKKYWDMIDVNVVGMARLTKLVVPHMKKRKLGLIINLASIAGRRVGVKGSFYSATKFAVMGYSEGLRKDLASFGIKVSTVCPGLVKTNFLTKKEYQRRMKEIWHNHEPTMLEAQDIAGAIGFICSQPAHAEVQDMLIMPFG